MEGWERRFLCAFQQKAEEIEKMDGPQLLDKKMSLIKETCKVGGVSAVQYCFRVRI